MACHACCNSLFFKLYCLSKTQVYELLMDYTLVLLSTSSGAFAMENSKNAPVSVAISVYPHITIRMDFFFNLNLKIAYFNFG
jgi:hypothetical protein